MAQKLNIIIDQGSTFQVPVTVTTPNGDPIDLADCQVYAQMRRWYTSNVVAANFTATVNAPSNTGIVTLSLSANDTANIEGGRYVYDAVVVDRVNNVIRVVEGQVKVNPGVTQSVVSLNTEGE